MRSGEADPSPRPVSRPRLAVARGEGFRVEEVRAEASGGAVERESRSITRPRRAWCAVNQTSGRASSGEIRAAASPKRVGGGIPRYESEASTGPRQETRPGRLILSGSAYAQARA